MCPILGCLTPLCLGFLFSLTEFMIPQFWAFPLALTPEDTSRRTESKLWEGLRTEALTGNCLEQFSALPDYRRFHEAEVIESQTLNIHWTFLFMVLKDMDPEASTWDTKVYSWQSKRRSFGGRHSRLDWYFLGLQWPQCPCTGYMTCFGQWDTKNVVRIDARNAPVFWNCLLLHVSFILPLCTKNLYIAG